MATKRKAKPAPSPAATEPGDPLAQDLAAADEALEVKLRNIGLNPASDSIPVDDPRSRRVREAFQEHEAARQAAMDREGVARPTDVEPLAETLKSTETWYRAVRDVMDESYIGDGATLDAARECAETTMRRLRDDGRAPPTLPSMSTARGVEDALGLLLDYLRQATAGVTAIYLGDGKVKVGDAEPFTLTPVQTKVVEALVTRRSATLYELRGVLSTDEPHKAIGRILAAHPELEPFLKRPGRSGKGNYSTTLVDGRPQNHH